MYNNCTGLHVHAFILIAEGALVTATADVAGRRDRPLDNGGRFRSRTAGRSGLRTSGGTAAASIRRQHDHHGSLVCGYVGSLRPEGAACGRISDLPKRPPVRMARRLLFFKRSLAE